MDNQLFDLALDAMKQAYAPYSKFKVGSSIRTVNGKLYCGSNVENAAYPEGSCAEAGAISAMICDGERQIQDIAVIGESKQLVTPCGGCRQKIREFSDPTTSIQIYDQSGLRQSYTLEQLLPDSFGPDNLL